MIDEYFWKNSQDIVQGNEHLFVAQMSFVLLETNLLGSNQVSRENETQFTSRL